ncbi:MAG TPA: amidohydrolase family protein [Candidatus Eisenbacteria bacterium]|nr:amidohydrolase family protein [Candidatus Eisenbacteria bacterium]
MKRLLAVCLFLAVSAFAQTIVIRAGILIDPATGAVAKNQVILVKDKKIQAVGAGVSIPKDAQIIDLSSQWVMPGIMDAHTHVTQSVKYFHELDHNYLAESTGLRALKGLRIAQTLLNAGVTTVRDVGNDANFAAVDLRKAIDAGWFVGPTVQTAGKIIAPYGGQSSGIPPEIGPFWRFEYYDADSPDEIRKAIRENIFYGADLIKLVADNSDYHYSVEEVRAAVEEAHHANRPVAVHVLGGEAADNVIAAGVDSIEHGFYLTDDQLRRMKEKGIVLSSTDFPTSHFEGGEFNHAQEIGVAIIDRLRRAHKVGVKIGFSTDIVTDYKDEDRAQMTWDYLAVWRAAGVPNAEVLKSMTTINAELLRIQKDRGAIAKGLFADIIAMPSSPLDDTESLRKVDFVMKNGTVVRKPR